MNGQIFAGREISVVVAAETRKRPEEMRHKTRVRGPPGHGSRRSSYYGHSRSRSVSRSRSPRHPPSSRSRYHSRSYSPVPRRRGDYSISPSRRHVGHPRSPRGPPRERDDDYSISPSVRHVEHPRSPRGPPRERDGDHIRRSYSPGYDNAADHGQSNGYGEKSTYEPEAARGLWRSSPGRASRSPSGSRSRSVDLSPRRSR